MGVVLDEAGGAGGLKEEGGGEVGRGFDGGEGVKGEAGVAGEGLAGVGVAGGTRGELGEEGVGQGQGFRGQGLEDGGEGLALLAGGDGAGDEGLVATDGVTVVDAADELGGGFGLVAVEEIEGDEGVFELGHGLAGLDDVWSEAGEGGLADGEDAGELGCGVGAVVPEVGVGVGGAEGAGVFVGDVAEAGGFVLAEEGVEGFGFVGAGSELGVAETDGGLVPGSDADGVGVVEGGFAGGVEGDEGVGVVHDGGALAEGGGGEVVLEAEGVADLVGGELTGAGEDHVAHGGGNGGSVEVGSEEGLGDKVVLTGAETAEGDLAFDDFSGAGVGDGLSVAPAASGAVDPLDHVVADIHGIGAFGEDFHAEGVLESGGLKGCGPPACAFNEGGADGLGGAAVDVVDDGLYGLGESGGGVALLEAVADEEALVERIAEGLGVVAELVGVEAGAGVEAARLVAGAGEFDEGGVLAEGDGVGVWGHLGNEFAIGRAVGDEGEEGLNLSVLGEGFGVVEGDGGAGGVDAVGALMGLFEAFGDTVGIAEEEVGGFDEECALRFGFDFESPEDAFGEGLGDGEALGGVWGAGAVVEVGLDEEELAADAGEVDDASLAELAAVEADVVGAEAVGELVEEEEVAVGGGDFEVELALMGVPMEGEESGDVGEGGSFFGDGGEGGGGLG